MEPDSTHPLSACSLSTSLLQGEPAGPNSDMPSHSHCCHNTIFEGSNPVIATLGPNCEEETFHATISTVRYNGVSAARRVRVGDFVKTHEGDLWGNIVELENEVVTVRGFCTGARKLTKRLNRAQVGTQDVR